MAELARQTGSSWSHFEGHRTTDIPSVWGAKMPRWANWIRELSAQGVRVPRGGSPQPQRPIRLFLSQQNVSDQPLRQLLSQLDIHRPGRPLQAAGAAARQRILAAFLAGVTAAGDHFALRRSCATTRCRDGETLSVAVRFQRHRRGSPDASFAGRRTPF